MLSTFCRSTLFVCYIFRRRKSSNYSFLKLLTVGLRFHVDSKIEVEWNFEDEKNHLRQWKKEIMSKYLLYTKNLLTITCPDMKNRFFFFFIFSLKILATNVTISTTIFRNPIYFLNIFFQIDTSRKIQFASTAF